MQLKRLFYTAVIVVNAGIQSALAIFLSMTLNTPNFTYRLAAIYLEFK